MVARLSIELLEAFVQVVKTGSFTTAGIALNRTQPCVSMQVRRLEEKVGTSLIKREANNIKLTGRGEVLFSYASSIVSLADEAYQRLSSPEFSRVVRLGIPEWYATHEIQMSLPLRSAGPRPNMIRQCC